MTESYPGREVTMTRTRLIDYLIVEVQDMMDQCRELSLPDEGSEEEGILVNRIGEFFDALTRDYIQK